MQNERKAVTRLTLDLQLGDVQKSFGLTKGDVNRRLEFTLIDGGRPFEIPSNWTVWLVGTKPDETELKLGCVVERGRVIYDLASGNQLSACEGYFPIWLTIFNEAGEEVYSPGVGVDVRPGPNTMNSEDQNTAIAVLIAKINGTQEEVGEIQSRLPELAREVRLSTLTIPASEWTDNTPTTAVTAIEGVEDENDYSFTALLLPVNNETRVASRDTSIYVENVDVRGNGKITVTMKREGEPPATDLKYVVIAFTEPNETGKAFPVSVGFIGVGGSGAGDGGETDGITEHELSKAIYDHNVSDESHEDIRMFLSSLEKRLGTLADSDDTTLDQLSEIVAYIKANKALIDSVTTAKVNVVDIIDNLSTNVSNKPLSAAQGVKLNQSVVKLTTDYDGLKKSVDDLLEENSDLPEYWKNHVSEKAEEISTIQDGAGQDWFSYAVIADTHFAQQRGSYTGSLAKQISDKCGINFVLCLGDMVSRGTIESKDASEAEFNGFWELMKPVIDRLLVTQGNHDGYYYNGNANYYPLNEALARVYNGMRVKYPLCWSENGAGYAVDDNASKTRFIMLNTSARPTGSTLTNYMNTFGYTQAQYEMLYWCLLTIPNDRWRVVVASHVAPVWVVDRFGDGVVVTDIRDQFSDAKQMIEMLNAYVSRGKASISHGTNSNDFRYVRMDVDFTGAKGSLIAYHAGHYHVDKVFGVGNIVNDDQTLLFPVILHRCDSFNENQGSQSSVEAQLEAERVQGTATEHSFDIVTVDLKEGVIHCTKIGAGENREIHMDGSTENPPVTPEEPKPSYKNLADPASSDWLLDSRLGSGAASESAGTDNMVTNYIPCKKGDIIRVKNFNIGYFKNESGALRCHYLNADKSIIGNTQPYSNGAFLQIENDGRYGIFSWEYIVGTTGDQSTYLDYADDIAYMRFCGYLADGKTTSDVIITVNQEIQ